MHYEVADRMLTATDPMGTVTATTYNTVGQPGTITSTMRGSTIPAETIGYLYDSDGRTTCVSDHR